MPASIAYKPGDKIGFSGYHFESALINLGTYGSPNLGSWWPGWISHISHVAVIGQYKRKVYLFESTTDEDCSLPCAITGKRINGVQAHPIEERIAGYVGKVWHYSLVTPLYPDQVKRSTEFLVSYLGRGYDEPGAIACGLASWTYGLRFLASRLGKDSLEMIYCSELCAAHDANTGIFQTDRASLWSPNYLLRTQRRRSILTRPIRRK